MVAFLLRSLRLTILALIPLIVGTSLTLNLMWLFGGPFQPGQCALFTINSGRSGRVRDYHPGALATGEVARVITLPAGTAKGVLLASLTTAVGFGSLMISGHQGTFSLGLLSTVGSLSVLLAALSVLPALLRLVRERHHDP